MMTKVGPLMKKQLRAVELQEKNNGYRLDFIDQFSSREIEAALRTPGLGEAEALFRELLREEKSIPPDALAVTAFQLGMLVRSQGKYVEAKQIFGGIVTKCRLIADKSNETEWALCRSLLRLAELECGEDRG